LEVLAGGICAAADNKVHCFSLDLPAQQFILKTTLEVKQQGIADICIRQDQRLFATAGWDGKIRVFHYQKQKALAVLQVSFVAPFFRTRGCEIISLNRLCTLCEAASAAPSFMQTIHKEDVTQSLSRHLSIGCILQASCESSVCFGVDCRVNLDGCWLKQEVYVGLKACLWVCHAVSQEKPDCSGF